MNSAKACLVVHGLTGVPENMASIVEGLQAAGFEVATPLLAGHGKDFATLEKTTWQEWYDSANAAASELLKTHDSIYYVGLSMGSLLGLKLAADLGSKIQALALLATPFKLHAYFRCIIPLVRYTPLRWLIRSTAKNYEKSVYDPKGREIYKTQGLNRMPSRCVFQTDNLQKETAKLLSKITQPLLLIAGAKDHLVDASGMLMIKNGVGSKEVAIEHFKESAHVLPFDYGNQELAQKIVDFFKSH